MHVLRENNIEILQLDGNPKEKDVVDLQSEINKVSPEKIKVLYPNHSFDPLLYTLSVGPNGISEAAIIANSKLDIAI